MLTSAENAKWLIARPDSHRAVTNVRLNAVRANPTLQGGTSPFLLGTVPGLIIVGPAQAGATGLECVIFSAALNFGDCFAYEMAKENGCPLLYVGDDFAKTDLVGVG
jgi:hypothetical protein